MNRTPQRFILPYEPGYTAHRAEDARRLKIREWLERKSREPEQNPATAQEDEKR